MRCVLALVVSLAAIASDAAQTRLNPGENLLQPFPPPESGWKARGGRSGSDDIVEWLRDDGKHLLRTTIEHKAGGYPASRRAGIDKEAAEKACRPYIHKSVESTPTNGFMRELWLADCGHSDGSSLTILHLYITGSDSGYYVQRFWASRPSEADIDIWIEYFKRVSVCDTREERAAPCP